MASRLKRKSFFIDERELDEARRVLGAGTDAETVRAALREVARMRVLARFMNRTRAAVPPGSFTER